MDGGRHRWRAKYSAPIEIHRHSKIYYRPKRSFGQGNIFTPVCHSFCSQGGEYLTRHPPPQPGRYTPPGPDPPRDQTPQDQTPPKQTPPEQTPPEADTPPRSRHPPGYGQRSAGTHPTGMHSCLLCMLVYVMRNGEL